jgi:four helix bundle protein
MPFNKRSHRMESSRYRDPDGRPPAGEADMTAKNPTDNGAPGSSCDDGVTHEHAPRTTQFAKYESRPTPHPIEPEFAHEARRESRTPDPRATQSAKYESRPTTHPHEHALAHEGPNEARGAGLFPHEKLDAYQVALQMAALSKKLAKEIPRGHRSIADHMLRAAANTALLLAEGANRRGDAQKRQRFVESRGECAEVAAAADLLLVLDIGSPTDAETLKHLASRVSAMLTRLIGRLK